MTPFTSSEIVGNNLPFLSHSFLFCKMRQIVILVEMLGSLNITLKIFIYLVFGWAGSSLLCRLFSSCSEQGLLSSCSAQASHWDGFSCCGPRAPEHRLSSWGTWASLPHRMWDLPAPGFKPMSPALTCRLFTTEPPGKNKILHFKELCKLPWWLRRQRIYLQCRRSGFYPWVRKIPRKREWLPNSSILAWRIPWTEEPGRLQFMGSQRVGQNWATKNTSKLLIIIHLILQCR